MTRQYQNAHGLVCVTGAEGRYIDTVENFTKDYGRPPPVLPEGVIDQLYEPGRRNSYNDGKGNVIGGGPVNWSEGDVVIAALAFFLAAQMMRMAREEEAAAAKRDMAGRVERKGFENSLKIEQEKLPKETGDPPNARP